jgi:glutamine synthetase
MEITLPLSKYQIYSLVFDHHESILSQALALLKEELNLIPVIGAEVEFYINGGNIENLLTEIMETALNSNIYIKGIDKEKGPNQYEVKLAHIRDITKLAEDIIKVKEIVTKVSSGQANFQAKPFPELPGNALHINLTMLNNDGENIFGNGSNDLDYGIGGLCKLMKESIICFAPKEESYKRFTPNLDAPTTISWGGNNRTTAIRIPSTFPRDTRIEYRVAGVDANPYAVISAILIGIHYGIKNQIMPPTKIYGNASDVQYKLEALPNSLEKAKWLFNESVIWRQYLTRLFKL